MRLDRITPNPFENYDYEQKMIGLSRYNYRPTKFYGETEWSVVTKFERFGNGSRRSDFEVGVTWKDIENIMEKFCEVGCPNAIAVRDARMLAAAATNLGWKMPEMQSAQASAA